MRDVIDDFVIPGDHTLSTRLNSFHFWCEECAQNGTKRHPIEKNIPNRLNDLKNGFLVKGLGRNEVAWISLSYSVQEKRASKDGEWSVLLQTPPRPGFHSLFTCEERRNGPSTKNHKRTFLIKKGTVQPHH